jgi:threonine dehydrogenase-like Zn-dependent dehydrogenase
MRAVQLDFADSTFPASLIEIEEPALPGPAWARIEVATGGICGSDLHLFTHNTGPSPTLVGFVDIPFLLGHEIAGRVIEAGPECDMAVGTRVAVQPTIVCEARDINPPCPPCARGDISSCQNLDSGVITPGMALGFTRGLGGGWADQVVAHRSMLFPIPDGVPDRAASLHEPVSIAVHGVLRQPPPDGADVVVVGCGIIGLAAIAALRTLFPNCPVTAIARHPHQAKAAAACGATHVVQTADDLTHMEELAQLSGTRVIGGRRNRMLVAGFPYVVEAVGTSSSVNEALRLADNRGTVLLLGAAGRAEYDLTTVWWKELALVGAINHSVDAGPHGGPHRHSVAQALDILAAGALPDDVVVTHEFDLGSYRDAIETAIDRQAGAIKVVFRPGQV